MTAGRVPEPTRRLRTCVENWPDCWTMGYDPRCCRFPKSCSCTVYDESRVGDDDLEPVTAGRVPEQGAEETDRCGDCGGARSAPGATGICAAWHRPAPNADPAPEGIAAVLDRLEEETPYVHPDERPTRRALLAALRAVLDVRAFLDDAQVGIADRHARVYADIARRLTAALEGLR